MILLLFYFQFEKVRIHFEAELENHRVELDNLRHAKTESDRKRKIVENDLNDQIRQNSQLNQECEQLTSRIEKLDQELDLLMKQKEQDSTSNIVLQKRIAALETELIEAQEARDEANSAKASLLTKLRQAEEANSDMLDKMDDLQFNIDKMNKVRYR